MHIRTYQAENMQKALKLVRRDLGSQAIIVTTKSFGKTKRTGGAGGQGGVEVVAAIDYDLDSSALEAKDFSQLITNSVSPANNMPGKKHLLKGIPHERNASKEMVRGVSRLSENPETDSIAAELKELKWMTQFLVRKTGEINHKHLPEELFRLSCQMLKQEVCEELVLKLMGALQQELSPEALSDKNQVKKGLISRMKQELPLSGPLDVRPGTAKVAAFVGPTGVGKTTTVAKLAAREGLSNKKKVALVSIDNYRIAALEQLRIYATIMDLPFKAVSSPEELERTLAHFADKDLILIDTAGRSQRDNSHLTEIKQFLRQSFPVEIYLVMSVTHKENNLSAISRQYGLLPIDRLIFSKLDESCTYGAMLNQLARIKKPLSYLTTGQKVPEDIEIATQERIVSLLLGETEIHYC
jgi:flagellar biosynthesis protein FlhF